MTSPAHRARHATLLGLALAMHIESASAQTKPTESAAPRAVSRSGVDWISRFEAPLPDAAFGAGWGVSTDQAAGGRSTARLSVVHGGATGSPHALSVEGVVDGALPYAWAGASFYPGEVRYGPADLSSKDSLVFWARSNGATFRVMLLSTAPDGREARAERRFQGSHEWTRVALALKEFRGVDLGALQAVTFSAGPRAGAFALLLDDVRFR
jgi:hypothetical protein